jgi:hypothetical protein
MEFINGNIERILMKNIKAMAKEQLHSAFVTLPEFQGNS